MSVGIKDLFWGFLKIGMMGFGGVAAVARHMVVEKYKWLDDRDYAAMLGIGQIVPGANVTNFAILFGLQNAGIPGSCAAVGGLLAVPLLVLVLLSSAYSQASNNPHIVHALAGMASVSGGVLLGTGFKMVRKAKLDITGFVFVGAGFVAVAAFHVPMIWVLLALLPVSIGSAWLKGIPS